MHKRTIAVTLTAASALVAAVLAAPPGAQATPSPKAIPNTTPTWLGHAQHLGHANAPVSARVYLAPNGGLAALQHAVAAVSTPGSSEYRHFLTPQQYYARYSASSASVHAVESWLRSSGLTVTGVEAHNRYVSISGSVAAAQKAFGTRIEKYRHDGKDVQAPSSALSVPAALAGSVLTVSGLDTTPHLVAPTNTANTPAPPPAGFRNARPCSVYFGQIQAKYQADFKTPLPAFHGNYLPYAPCGYTGPQFRAAYEGNTRLSGAGVTVAIVDAYASPTIRPDANRYASTHGDGSYAPGQFTQAGHRVFTHAAQCGPSGWYSEESLDVEAVHAMAPGANIRYYGAASCYDSDLSDALAKVVDENLAQLVTNSYGEIQGGESADQIAAYEQVFMQGDLQGISFMFSSGDSGDELAASGVKQADYPTSDPYVTSVGGTSTAIGASGALKFETGWGTVKYSLSSDGTTWNPVGFLYGAGGGASTLFQQPAYQAGVAPGPYRTVPDVAMDADPNTGMLIGLTQTFPSGPAYGEYRIGGTSLASPLFAGMTALSLQNAGRTTMGAGLLNPTIYANASTGVFTDVTNTPRAGVVRVDFANGLDASNGLVYSVRTFGHDSSLMTGPGWDDVTGVGTPNTGWLTAIH
ncbi:MAG: S53 family peptidase [Jatrophihabitantaceae bacterium]